MNVLNQLKKLTIRKPQTDTNTMTLKQEIANQMNYTRPVIGQTEIPQDIEASALKVILQGKTLRYECGEESSITQDGQRTFKVETVENVFVAKKNGIRCVTIYGTDMDDGGKDKYRTLHIDGIRVIA
mgnify:FL=1